MLGRPVLRSILSRRIKCHPFFDYPDDETALIHNLTVYRIKQTDGVLQRRDIDRYLLQFGLSPAHSLTTNRFQPKLHKSE